MKKLVSLLLVGLMSITMLTGCGVNDLGYLNLSKEISNMTEFNFENKTQIKVSKEIAEKDYNIDLDIKGSANIEDLDSMYMSFDVLFKLNDIGVEKPINFKIVDNKVYVSKSALLEVAALEESIEGKSTIKKVMQELHKNDLKNVEYILLADLGTTYEDTNSIDMAEKGMNYLTTAFKGFDSKLITKTAKGYSLELTSEGALAFAENVIKYLSENKALVFDETVKYVEDIYNNIEVKDVSEEEMQAMITALKQGRQDFYDSIDQAAILIKSDEVNKYLDMVKGSKIKEEIYKEGTTYKEVSEAELVYEDVKMGNFVSTSSITPAKVQKEAVKGEVMEIEKLETLYNKVENKINPINKMKLEWSADSVEAQVENIRLEGNSGYDFKAYKIIDGRIYLPLRYISETFGEEVEWDNASRKAYIVRGTEKIEMTGVIIDSQTMIKVKDFEKLGYKVAYTQVDGISTATIEK